MSVQIPNFHHHNVLVVGDTMLDRYWHGSTHRISPEAPVPVVNIQGQREVPGGAGNVAVNLKALNCNTSLIGVIGADLEGELLQQQLTNAGVNSCLQVVEGVQTITKLRVIGRHQQLVRLDFEHSLHDIDISTVLTEIQTQLQTADVMVISDYNKGINANMQAIIALAHQANVPVLVDPKVSDYSLYRGATLLTPNMKEFEAVVGPCVDEQAIVRKGTQLIEQQGFQALLVTRGEDGMTLLQKDQAPAHFSAQTQEVFDVTGAGDTVIAVLAAAMAAKVPLEKAAMMANVAAGISVSKLGAATVSVPELRRALQSLSNSDMGIVNQVQLLQAVEDARAHGETIVMTNGCFDILHAGHVHYLERAKALGHRLIVAVNSDDSIARLKGAHRPVVPLDQRMMVLAGLRSVDWVVPFSEDTPESLIADILPDVLVKGADYQVHQIAGAQAVMDAGGRVETIGLIDGVSTTQIIERSSRQEELV